MERRPLARLSVLLALAVDLVACGGGGSGGGPSSPPPSIASFEASSTLARAGDEIELIAVFDGADAIVVPGGASLSSGVPIVVVPADDTTYTLVVTGAGDALATADVSVSVVDLLLVVTSADDDGPGTLRDALERAGDAPSLRTAVTVSLAGLSTVVLESPLPSVMGTLFLVGPPSPAGLTIDGGGAHRILFVEGGRAVLSD